MSARSELASPAAANKGSSVTVTGSRVLSLGHYQPSRVLTNDDLRAEWSTPATPGSGDRVGIADAPHRRRRTRRWPTWPPPPPRRRSAGSGLSAADIDLVVVATCSSVDRCPNVADPGGQPARHRRARRLTTSTPRAPVSPTRWRPSTTPIRAGASRNAIVIGAEKLSDVTDWTDRSTVDHLRRRRRRRAWSPPAAEGEPPASARWCGAPAPEQGRHASRSRAGARTSCREGQAVFRWATTALAPVALAGRASAPVSTPARSRHSLPTRPTRASSTASPSGSTCPMRSSCQRHRRVGQHLGRERPVGPVQARRAAGGALGRAGAARSASAAASPTPGRSFAARIGDVPSERSSSREHLRSSRQATPRRA